MNMPKSREIQTKMPSPKVILNAFWFVTVKILNSYEIKKLLRDVLWQRFQSLLQHILAYEEK